MKKRVQILRLLLSCCLLAVLCGCAPASSPIYANRESVVDNDAEIFLPGAQWSDTAGTLIQAHGGQVQRMPVPDEAGNLVEMYVWVGEDKWSGHFGNCVAVYTSDDLYHWTYGGDVLRSVSTREALDTDPYFLELYAGYSDGQLDNVFNIIGADKVRCCFSLQLRRWPLSIRGPQPQTM